MQSQLEFRACPVCGSEDQDRIVTGADIKQVELNEYSYASRKLPDYMHYQIIACPTCALYYVSPAPRQAEVLEAYHSAAYDSSQEADYASLTYGKFLAKIKLKLPDLIGALDIGTGNGGFLEELAKAGFTKIEGVEPSTAPIEAAKSQVKPLIRHGYFRPEDYSPNEFALITCFQTLEHLHEPLELSRSAYELLKPGGAVFFVCHNHQALSARLLKTRSPIYDIEHMQLFCPEAARFLLQQAGFKNIEIQRVYNAYPLHYWVKLFPLPLKLKRPLISFLKRIKIGELPVKLSAGNIAIIGYK